MSVSLASLQRLISLNLSTEQMAGVMEVLAAELAPLEAIRHSNRERQKRYAKREPNVMVGREASVSLTPEPSRVCVDDNIINTTTNSLENKNLSLSLSKPLRANGTNPRAVGTNPRALGTNPRAVDAEPEGFSEFWDNYPKRDGSADRKGAVKAFRAALKRASLETILDGAEHFREAMTARGKVGTEFIPQARTWLNSDRWSERYDTATVADSRHTQNLAILEKYRAAPRS